MEVHEAATLLLAKMALADDHVADVERGYLGSMLPDGADVDALVERARSLELPAITEAVSDYADRFVVAMRVAVMATLNLDLDVREYALFEQIVQQLRLLPEDCLIIREEAAARASLDDVAAHPRIQELRALSALSSGASAIWPRFDVDQ